MASVQDVVFSSWIEGLLDDAAHFKSDEKLIGALREAVNVTVTSTGAVRTRPELALTSAGYKNVDNVESDNIWVVSNPDVTSAGNVDDYVYVFVNDTTQIVVYRVGLGNGGTSGWTTLGAIPWADITIPLGELEFCIAGNTLFVCGAGINVYAVTSSAITKVKFYKEISGTIHWGRKLTIAAGGVCTSTTDAANPKFAVRAGDVIVAKAAGAVIGTAIAVAYDGDWSAPAAGTKLHVKDYTGSFTGADTLLNLATGDTYTLVGAIAANAQVFVAEAGTSIADIVAGSGAIRVAGTDYTYTAASADDFSFGITTSFSGQAVSGLRVAKEILDSGATSSIDRAVYMVRGIAFVQGRLVLAGPCRQTVVYTGLIPTTRIWWSSAYDPYVVRPAPQLEPDAAQPIEVDMLIGGSDIIHWLESGDTLFIGGKTKVYAVTNQTGVYALPEGLPRFAVVADRRSDGDTAHAQHDGRVAFTTERGGVVEEMEYDFASARFKQTNLAYRTESKFGSVKTIVTRPRTADDPVDRIITVETGSGSGRTGMIGARFDRDSKVAWSEIVLSDYFTLIDAVTHRGETYLLVKLITSVASEDYVTFVKLDSSNTDGYFMDFRETFTGASSLTWDLGDYWKNKYVYVLARYGVDSDGNPRYLPLGYYQSTNDANATITIDSHATGVTGYTEIVVGLCPEARVKVAKPIVIQDEKGNVIGRPHRIVQVTPEAYNTRQMTCMDTNVFPEVRQNLSVDLPVQNGGARVHRMSLWRDLEITAASVAPYSFLLRSLTVRVAL